MICHLPRVPDQGRTTGLTLALALALALSLDGLVEMQCWAVGVKVRLFLL